MFLVIVVCVLTLTTISAQSQQQIAPTTPAGATGTAPVELPQLEYSGVFYARNQNGTWVPLPHKSPKVKSMFGRATNFLVVAGGLEVSSPIFLVKLEGSGDPSQTITMAAVEQGGKIPIKGEMVYYFAKGIDLAFRNLGNRIFEVKPATSISGGDYALALGSGKPFEASDCFLFHIATK